MLLAIAVAHRAWNAWAVKPLTGYDAPGHMGYVLTIVTEHRLPQPTEGWSTFHPPLYYLVASGVWATLEPFGPRAVLLGIRAVGVVLGFATALVTHRLIRRFGGGRDVALVGMALVLFVPCNQIAATMEGNEAFAAGIAAMGLPALLRLQADPRSVRAAILLGSAAGFAAISKFTGLALLAACIVPFLRTDLDRSMGRALLALGVVFMCLAGPVYARNILIAGSPFPMTRGREPMHTAERVQIIRPRRLHDYFSVGIGNVLRPSVFHLPGRQPLFRNKNPAMTSVPGLLYASLWWDPFAHRIDLRYHRDGIRSGPRLVLLGLVPTLLMLAGFVLATFRALAGRLRAPEAPLVAMALAGMAMLLLHTWVAPSTASVKASYLLQVAPVAGVFFSLGVGLLGPRLRAVALAVSLAAAVVAAFVFTEGVLFHSTVPGVDIWTRWSRQLPRAHIEQAMKWLLGIPYDGM